MHKKYNKMANWLLLCSVLIISSINGYASSQADEDNASHSKITPRPIGSLGFWDTLFENKEAKTLSIVKSEAENYKQQRIELYEFFLIQLSSTWYKNLEQEKILKELVKFLRSKQENVQKKYELFMKNLEPSQESSSNKDFKGFGEYGKICQGNLQAQVGYASLKKELYVGLKKLVRELKEFSPIPPLRLNVFKEQHEILPPVEVGREKSEKRGKLKTKKEKGSEEVGSPEGAEKEQSEKRRILKIRIKKEKPKNSNLENINLENKEIRFSVNIEEIEKNKDYNFKIWLEYQEKKWDERHAALTRTLSTNNSMTTMKQLTSISNLVRELLVKQESSGPSS